MSTGIEQTMAQLFEFPDSEMLPRIDSIRVINQSLKHIDDRRKGLIKALKTKYLKLNYWMAGGIELDTIMCVSALSGGGKSTITKTLRDSIAEMNKDLKIKQLIFNFEMLAHHQASRSLSAKKKMPLRNIYSVDEPLSDEEFEYIKTYYEELAKRDIDFVEVSGTAVQIARTIYGTWRDHCKGTDKILVYEVDHALLTLGKNGDKEKEKIDDLMLALVLTKKKISSEGGHSVGIVLSQMNREIKKVERRMQPELHRPDTSCMMGSSSIEFACDYIIVAHIPAKLQLPFYGPDKKPTRYKYKETPTSDWTIVQIPYFELLKQRSGESDLTFAMENLLKYFDFDEMDANKFKQLHQTFEAQGFEGIPELNMTPGINFTKQ
jgi:replicative DNA helicase